MIESIINYYEVLGLSPKQSLTRNIVLDAYLDAKNAITKDSKQSVDEMDEKLCMLSEALTVIMTPELRKDLKLAIFESKKQNTLVDKTEILRNSVELTQFSDKTLFEALIAYANGNKDHHISNISKYAIEKELLFNRLWAMHVIKDVVNTKKLPKSLR